MKFTGTAMPVWINVKTLVFKSGEIIYAKMLAVKILLETRLSIILLVSG